MATSSFNFDSTVSSVAPDTASPSSQNQQTSHSTQLRKAEHIRICLDEDVQFRQTTGLERYRFTHCCLPETDWNDINIATRFLGKPLGTPLLISSMTGGTEQAQLINQRLAIAAQRYGMAMGVGSQRVAIENPNVVSTFSVRDYAPDILLLANLGAVQLNYDYGLDECLQAVEWLNADALILHINPLQECVQSRGDTDFSGLLDKIAALCRQLPVPVVAKEVGNGISGTMVTRLLDAGISAIDVAGAGGTSWAQVERERATDPMQRRLGETFANWGIPTADCILQAREVAPDIPLIASGGLRNGLEVATAIALGADLSGMAFPFLQAAAVSQNALDDLAKALIAELKTALFCTGSVCLNDLRHPGILTAVS